MKPIDGIDLPLIVEEAATLEFEAARTTVRDRVRQLFQKKRALSEEVVKIERQLAKAKETLRKVTEKVETHPTREMGSARD